MGIETIGLATLLSAGSTAAGIGFSLYGTKKQASAEQDMSAASRAAEDARQQQATLEHARKQREIIRQGITARANAVSSTTNQGAQYSSALEGTLAQYTGQEAAASNTVGRAFDIGNDIFAANKDYATAQGQAATGKGLSSLGGMLLQNNVQIGKIGSLFGGGGNEFNPYQPVSGKAGNNG